MSQLPQEIFELLCERLASDAGLAWLQLDREGRLLDSGGRLERYRLPPLQCGVPAAEQLPFLHGLVPLGDARELTLPVVETEAAVPVQVNVLAVGDSDWVILLDVAERVRRDRDRQQSDYEALLQRERAAALPLGEAAARDAFAGLLAELDVALLERTGTGGFRLLGGAPGWLRAMAPRVRREETTDPAEISPFLENFLVDADAVWTAEEDGHLSSGPWTETDWDGVDRHYEAVAVHRGVHQLLLLKSLGAAFEAEREIVQRARENSLRFGREMSEQQTVAATLERERDEADAATRAKSEFLARLSHELRTPLNSVIGFGNVLSKNRGGNQTPQDLIYLARIVANGEHLLSLINDILDLSRIEAGRIEAELEPTDLHELVVTTAGQLQAQADARGVELRAESPAALAPVVTDPRRLRQVLINLAGNALKFTDEGSVTLRVIADDDGKPTAIDVIDTGIGIPAEDQARVFEAFQQSAHGGRQAQGTGLGLAITRGLVALLGYSIEMSSEVDRGTKVRVVIAGA